MSIQDINVKGGKKYRYRVYYIDKATNKKKQKNSKLYDTYNQAKEAEIEFEYSLLHDQRMRPAWKEESITFHVAYMQWFDWSTEGKSQHQRTIEDKQKICEKYYSSLYKLNMEDIKVEDIQHCFDDPYFQSLSTYRKNKILRQLKAIFKFANTYLKVVNNPTDYFQSFQKTSKERIKEVEILEIDEFNALLAQILPCHRIYRNLFYILYWTGLRLNEANSLTFKDIQNHRINLTKQWDHYRHEWTKLKTTKSRRKIKLDRDLEKIIKEQYLLYKDEPDFSEDWFIFGGSRQLPYTSMDRIKNNACKAAGIKQVKIHSFRHSHASNLLHNGVPLFKVSRRLGHSSVSITADLYGHLIEDEEDEIMSAIAYKE